MNNNPYQNPNYRNDLLCIPDLLRGLPEEIIDAEKFLFYCCSCYDNLEAALDHYNYIMCKLI